MQSGDSRRRYESPLVSRYATPDMIALWSPEKKFRTWRRLWVALARAEMELGLPVTAEQVAELASHVEDVNFEEAEAQERRTRHDVMAHVHAYGAQCPKARGIIHLGATSAYVGDNADLILLREGLEIILAQVVNVADTLAGFALKHKDMPTLGFTHFQPAQPTTVGKRACLWLQDLMMDLADLRWRIDGLAFLGVKGTTGTQASFLELFAGDANKVEQLESRVTELMGFSRRVAVSGQTYPRKIDAQVLSALSGIAQSAHKFANDLRLLCHLQEIEEPFGKEQVGSSAMAYKRNPRQAELMTALSRFIMVTALNADLTAAEQWFERTLDDSANRRLSLPETFLATNGMLNVYLHLASGLVVNPGVIARRLTSELPFIATENILMSAVKAGGDRQDLHERIRRHAQEAAARMKESGAENDLLERLRGDPAFAHVDFADVMNPSLYVGLAPQQAESYVENVVRPALAPYADLLGRKADVHV